MNAAILGMTIGMTHFCMAGVETGDLLGMSSESSCGPCINALFRIDLDNGEALVVGEFGVNPSEGALAVGPDGTLFGAFSGEFDSLVVIDPATGDWIKIGTFGFDDVSGLGFSPDGTLYGYDNTTCQLITVDPLTGQGTAVGPIGFFSGGGLAFSPGGILFAVGYGLGNPGLVSLWTVDVDSGMAMEVGPFPDDISIGDSLAFIGETLYASLERIGDKENPRSLYVVHTETVEIVEIGEFVPHGGLSMGGMAFLPGTGDADRDGDVDHDDFLIFESCFTGQLETEDPLPVECQFLDVDHDNDIDCDDWVEFINAWTADEDPPSFPPCDGCEGDANGDGVVDPLDSGFVLARFGCPVGEGDPDCDLADQNGDGGVDPLDVGFVLARFGPCE